MSARVAEIEELLGRLETVADPEARGAALELVRSLMDLHGEALARVVDLCESEDVLRRYAGDELVGSLLLLYGLHPDPVEQRVEAALERTRPYLRSHGGSVSLVRVEEGVVHLQLEGTCRDCASSARTLELAVEAAIFESAPEVTAVVTDAAPPAEAQRLPPGPCYAATP